MPKTKISEFSATPANNTDIDSINIAEGCAPSGINDAIRELMSQLKDFQTGAVGDSFNGPVNGTLGATTPATASVTTLAASGAVTLSGGTANGVTYLNGSKVLTSGSALTFDGTNLTLNSTTPPIVRLQSATTSSAMGLDFYYTDAGSTKGGLTANFGAGEVRLSSGASGNTYFQSFYTNGSERARIDSSGNVGIGTSSPSFSTGSGLQVNRAGTSNVRISNSTSGLATELYQTDTTTGFTIDSRGTSNFTRFLTDGTERARIDTSGQFMVGTSAGNSSAGGMHATGPIIQGASGLYQAQISISSGNTIQAATLGVGYETLRLNSLGGSVYINCTAIPTGANGGTGFVPAGAYGVTRLLFSSNNTATVAVMQFDNPNGNVGSIGMSGSSTYYSTSSDYRLKNTIAPMTGALAKVVQLKPVTYKWNADNSDGEGFIAHELAEVCPYAVIGQKDAVDEDGKPIHQGVDTSFLVATLTAALQELNAKFDAYVASHP